MNSKSLAALPLAFAFTIAACGNEVQEQPADQAADQTGQAGMIDERIETWDNRAQDAGTEPQDPAFPLDDNAKRADQLEEHAEAIGTEAQN